jgi:hypothetical protein
MSHCPSPDLDEPRKTTTRMCQNIVSVASRPSVQLLLTQMFPDRMGKVILDGMSESILDYNQYSHWKD